MNDLKEIINGGFLLPLTYMYLKLVFVKKKQQNVFISNDLHAEGNCHEPSS